MSNNEDINAQKSIWNERYSEEAYAYGEVANQFIQEAAHYLKEKSKIAAYAEGEGRNAVFLAEEGHTVTSYDYSQVGLRKTEALAIKKGVQVQTIQTDLIKDALPFETYDAAIMVFGHFPRKYQYHVLNKILHSLKLNGILVVEVYEENQINYGTGGPKEQNWLYCSNEFLTWSKNHRIKHFFTGEVERNEGTYHRGFSFVIQLVLEKVSK